jgi:hypothetical protein
VSNSWICKYPIQAIGLDKIHIFKVLKKGFNLTSLEGNSHICMLASLGPSQITEEDTRIKLKQKIL